MAAEIVATTTAAAARALAAWAAAALSLRLGFVHVQRTAA